MEARANNPRKLDEKLTPGKRAKSFGYVLNTLKVPQ